MIPHNPFLLVVIFSRYKLLRCRVASLVSQWINIKLSASVRPTLYESLLQLMTDQEDLVVGRILSSVVRSLLCYLFEVYITQGSYSNESH